MKLRRLTRLIELLTLLQGGRGHNVNSLAGACGVSRRTIFRDLDALKQAQIPLLFDEERQHYRIATNHLLPPTSFTPDEALAIMVLCHEMGGQSGLPFYAPARAAAAKLESNLPSRLREHLRGVTSAVRIRIDASNRLPDAESVYKQLLQALGARRCVRIRYRSLNPREIVHTKLQPYQLLFSRRSWYVIGRSSYFRQVRTFHVGRVEHLELLEEPYRIPQRFSLERHLRNAWHLIPEPGADHEIVIRFQPMVADSVAEVTWHKTQQVVRNADGTIDFHVTVSGLGEISWWVLSYGDQAEVLAPPALREIVLSRARGMLARYADGPSQSA